MSPATKTNTELEAEILSLRRELEESHQLTEALRADRVDAIVVERSQGPQVLVLADPAYLREVAERKYAQKVLEQRNAELEEIVRRLRAAAEEIVAQNEELVQQNNELSAAQATIAAERERYEDLFQSAPDGYLVTDFNGVVRQANRVALAMLGGARESVLGTPLVRFVQPDQRPAFLQAVLTLQRRRSRGPMGFRINSGAGESFDAELTAAVECADCGPYAEPQIRWMLRDVTERRRAEETLEQGRRTLSVALDVADMGTWVFAFAGNVCECGERAPRLYGLPSARWLHDEEGVRGVIHPDDIPRMWQAVQAACDPAGDGRYRAEYRVRRPDGGWRWLSALGLVEFDGEGDRRQAVRIVGTSRDITAARLVEERLYRANQRLHALMQAVAKPIDSKDLIRVVENAARSPG